MILEIIVGAITVIVSFYIFINLCEFIGWLGMKIFKKNNKIDGFIDILFVGGLIIVFIIGCYLIGDYFLEIIK